MYQTALNRDKPVSNEDYLLQYLWQMDEQVIILDTKSKGKSAWQQA